MKDEYKEILCRVRFIDGVPAKTYLSDIEIVRCKDCKYYRRNDRRSFIRGSDCSKEIIDTIVPDRDFCSKAEREEECSR